MWPRDTTESRFSAASRTRSSASHFWSSCSFFLYAAVTNLSLSPKRWSSASRSLASLRRQVKCALGTTAKPHVLQVP